MKSCIDFYDDSASVWADDWYANEQLLPYLKKWAAYTAHELFNIQILLSDMELLGTR